MERKLFVFCLADAILKDGVCQPMQNGRNWKYFWTASPTNGDNGLIRNLLFNDNDINRTEDRRYIGNSIRCIKNKN